MSKLGASGIWYLYLLECNNGSLYAGITNDVDQRYSKHVRGKGAKFTRALPPVRLVACRPYANRSEASRAEHAVRKLPKAKKIEFVERADITDV